jgi:tetratricopeptide (TPR) repeat protein
LGTFRIVITRILATLIVALLVALRSQGATGHPNSPAAEFDQANKLYEQGKFSEAAMAYEKLADNGATTASVWFNLGNAAYKSGQMGHAIAAYRMAERLTPRDASLRANLQFVRGKVYSDERTHVTLWKNIIRLATVNEWTVLTVALLWAFFSVLACAEAAGRRYTRTALSLLFVALLSCGTLAAAWQEHYTSSAIVTAKEATVRFGPLDESQAAFQLRDGAELTVISSKDNWLQVRDPEKRIGWIRRDEVSVLPIISGGSRAGQRATL